MNNDTNPLQERIARILNDEGWTFEGVHEPGDYDECEDCRLAAAPIAARIAQEIAAEVQAAKAEALREAAGPEWGNSNTLWGGPRVRAKITRRATEYETGDRA